jgi:thiol-disulfide isomerase/thioredoxin
MTDSQMPNAETPGAQAEPEPREPASVSTPPKAPTPGRARRSRLTTGQKVLAWVGALALALAVGSGIILFSKTGTSPSKLARLYGFSVADFRAEGRRESRPAPNLVGKDFNGKQLALSDYRGKIVVLNVWGSWCGPCRREEPQLVAASKAYASRGVQFLGVDVRDQKAAANAFREEFGVTYPSFFDDTSELAYKLQVQAVPSTFIIDRNQRIFFRFTGAIDSQLLQTALTAVLEESKG